MTKAMKNKANENNKKPEYENVFYKFEKYNYEHLLNRRKRIINQRINKTGYNG